MKIIIFGSGISGLTIAHELLNSGHEVTIYEKNSVPGGMAVTRRENNGTPSEHSWRGFAPVYINLYNLIKRIPFSSIPGSTETVFDQLSDQVVFLGPKDDVTDPDYNVFDAITTTDKLVAIYKILPILIAGEKRRKKYGKINLKESIYSHLSGPGKDLFSCLSPYLGLDPNESSYIDLIRYIEMGLTVPNYGHPTVKKQYFGQFLLSFNPTYSSGGGRPRRDCPAGMDGEVGCPAPARKDGQQDKKTIKH